MLKLRDCPRCRGPVRYDYGEGSCLTCGWAGYTRQQSPFDFEGYPDAFFYHFTRGRKKGSERLTA